MTYRPKAAGTLRDSVRMVYTKDSCHRFTKQKAYPVTEIGSHGMATRDDEGNVFMFRADDDSFQEQQGLADATPYGVRDGVSHFYLYRARPGGDGCFTPGRTYIGRPDPAPGRGDTLLIYSDDEGDERRRPQEEFSTIYVATTAPTEETKTVNHDINIFTDYTITAANLVVIHCHVMGQNRSRLFLTLALLVNDLEGSALQQDAKAAVMEWGFKSSRGRRSAAHMAEGFRLRDALLKALGHPLGKSEWSTDSAAERFIRRVAGA